MLDVGYIKYNKKEYPVRISYKALKGYKKKLGKSFSGDSDFESLETLLYYGLKSGAEYIETEFNFNEDEIEDILDECYLDFQRMLPKFFISNDEVGETEEGELKKKKK